MSKKIRFEEELKLVFQWANMLDEMRDSNSEEDDELDQTTRKPGTGMVKKFNTKYSKYKTSIKQ